MIEALPCVEDDSSFTPLYTKSFNIAQVLYAIDNIKKIYRYGRSQLHSLVSSTKISRYLEDILVDTIPSKYRFDNQIGKFIIFIGCANLDLVEFSYSTYLLQIILPYNFSFSSSPSIFGCILGLQAVVLPRNFLGKMRTKSTSFRQHLLVYWQQLWKLRALFLILNYLLWFQCYIVCCIKTSMKLRKGFRSTWICS